MPRAAQLSKESRVLRGKVSCECHFARNVFEMHPCDLILALPEGETISLGPKQYIRLKVAGRTCPNNHDFDVAIGKHRVTSGTGYVIFQEFIEDN